MSGDHAQRPRKVRKAGVADRSPQPVRHTAGFQKTLPWRKCRFDDLQQSPPLLRLPGDFLARLTVKSMAPYGADISPHACASHDIHFDAIFLEHLDDADVRKPLRAAGRKRKSHPASPDLPRESRNIAR